jgi:ribosomal protein S18 acetylase RimI-like enzyme
MVFECSGAPVGGIGVIWWIEVQPEARGAGIGRHLVDTALDLLWKSGAREAILYVDDDEPGAERDRTAANRLYDACGFVEVDRLYSYIRRRR